MKADERDQLRNVFFTAWRKHLEKLPVEPLEAQVIDLILLHPEYQDFFAASENISHDDFSGTNPFLHLSLHLSIREQIATNRPTGITEIHRQLCQKWQDPHAAEHAMLECLGQVLWEAQRSGQLPDEQVYLEWLRKL